MYIQGVNNYAAQPGYTTRKFVTNVQNIKSNGAVVEDTVKLSAEALDISANKDMEKTTYYEYIHDMSDSERNSFWSSIKSQLKPSYFKDATEHNINIAAKAAEQLVSDAKNQGKDIDVGKARVCIERWFGIDPEGSYQEACDMGLIDASKGIQLEIIDITKSLTDNEKVMLENMYNNARAKGLPTDQVDQIAFHLGFSRGLMGQNHELSPEFLEHLIEGIDKGVYQEFDAAVLQDFIDHFDAYTSSF